MNNNTLPEEPRTLVIGDVHGHYDRLIKLLMAQEILNNEGQRINHDVEVVQVGDLADFGSRSMPSQDIYCYKAVDQGWIDVVLWGNHDRAVRDRQHEFGGFKKPLTRDISHIMRSLEVAGKIKMAHAVHGHLITHAGLTPNFENCPVPEGMNPEDPYDVADYLNQDPSKFGLNEFDYIINGISVHRGGQHYYGGILWRDAENEELYDAFPQVFGHTSEKYVRQYGRHWCVDTSKYKKLGAIWLPDMTIVEVEEDE